MKIGTKTVIQLTEQERQAFSRVQDILSDICEMASHTDAELATNADMAYDYIGQVLAKVEK